MSSIEIKEKTKTALQNQEVKKGNETTTKQEKNAEDKRSST